MSGKISKISERVTYIGVDDATLDLFESQYPVPQGITYNSYIIRGEKIAVIDTTDSRTGAAWLENLKKGLNGDKPDYLVIEHLEPDHSSLISAFTDLYPDAELVMSRTALRMLPEYIDRMPGKCRLRSVEEENVLDLGGASLRFIMAPMVHWPEVMMAYSPEERLIFTADAFGTFGTADAIEGDWATEARRYYYNIVGKYGAQVQNALKKVSSLDIRTICPLHGPVLTEKIGHYVSLYDTWSRRLPETDGIFIACASIHGNTMEAAQYLAQQLRNLEAPNVYVADLTRDDQSADVALAFKFPMTIFCASTYDAGVFTPMYDFIHRLHTKGFCHRTAALVENGSWAPVAAKTMREMLLEMDGINILPDTLTIRGAFKESDRSAIDAFALKIAAAFRKVIAVANDLE